MGTGARRYPLDPQDVAPVSDSVFNRLGTDGRFVEALEFLLDRRVNPKRTEAIRCLDPGHHRNGDANPSAFICPDAGCVKCGTTGKSYGLAEIAVLRGKASTTAEAATLLEAHFYNGNGHKNGVAVHKPTQPWPYYPETAKALGWQWIEHYSFPRGTGAGPALRVPTYMPDGSPARTKIRGERGEHGVRADFDNDGDDCGLLNWPAVLDHCAGAQSPEVALVAGETDLLAWTWACKNLGLDIPAFSFSTGEGSTIAPEYASKLKGVRVHMVCDNDKAGLDSRDKNIPALNSAGARARAVIPPAPHKDLRDFVMAGGSIRELLKEEEVASPFAPISALDLLAKTLPPIDELVSPRIIYRGGVTVMVASHKRGKSLAALGLCVDLVLHVANPMLDDKDAPKWLGQVVLGSGPVLVYSAEGGERMVQERLRKMCPNRDGGLADLFVYAQTPAPQLDNPTDLDAVFAHAERVGAVLLVFDPLGRFWAMEDEGDPTTARNLMLAIQTRAEAAYRGRGIAVLVIHHDTKSSGADADSAVTGGRGSGKFGDDADALINLKIVQSGEPGESIAKFLLRHAESPSPVPVKIDRDSLRLVVRDEQQQARSGAAKGGRPPKLSLGALEELIRRKIRIEASLIPDQLGVAFNTWKNVRRDMLNELVEMGRIRLTTVPGTNRDLVVWTGGGTDSTVTTETYPS